MTVALDIQQSMSDTCSTQCASTCCAHAGAARNLHTYRVGLGDADGVADFDTTVTEQVCDIFDPLL